jgi:hypothetical protein
VDLAITWAENSATHICLQSSTKLGGNDRENYTGTVIKHEIINLSLSSKKTHINGIVRIKASAKEIQVLAHTPQMCCVCVCRERERDRERIIVNSIKERFFLNQNIYIVLSKSPNHPPMYILYTT